MSKASQLDLYHPGGNASIDELAMHITQLVLLEERIIERHSSMIVRLSKIPYDREKASVDIDYWSEYYSYENSSGVRHDSERLLHIRRVRGFNA